MKSFNRNFLGLGTLRIAAQAERRRDFMKCFNHPEEDAVGVCKSCGKGVCQECAVIIAGGNYCKTCLETGRVKATTVQIPVQPVAVARPSGIPTRASFIVGGVGAIISGVAALLSLFGGFGNIFYGAFFGFGSIWSIVGSIILGVGLILAGIGYKGIKSNYGVGTGTAGFAFSIVACVFVFVNVAFGIIGLPYGSRVPYYSDPWYSSYLIYTISAIITLILFGVMQILWGVAHINSRKYTGVSGLGMATGIMLIISGALTASVFIAFAGIVLFFISEILVVLVFLMSNIPKQTP